MKLLNKKENVNHKSLKMNNYILSLICNSCRKGDYCRYRAEYSKNEDGSKKDDSDCIEKGAEAYKKATELAKALPSTNPTRLGLALNYSVFYYEINQESAMACEIAKKVYIVCVCVYVRARACACDMLCFRPLMKRLPILTLLLKILTKTAP